MLVVNFSYPLTEAQRGQIEAQAGRVIERVIGMPTHFDHTMPFGPQIAALVQSVGLTSEEWQTLPLIGDPPGFQSDRGTPRVHACLGKRS